MLSNLVHALVATAAEKRWRQRAGKRGAAVEFTSLADRASPGTWGGDRRRGLFAYRLAGGRVDRVEGPR